MMGLDDIVLSFAISVGAGYVPNIINKIQGDKTLEDKINDCFNKALKKWDISQDTRDLLNCKSLKYYTELKDFITDKSKGIHPKIKELLHLWVMELRSDELCSNFIIMQQQELANDKLNDILSILNDDISLKISDLSRKNDNIQESLTKILSYIQNGNHSITLGVKGILDGIITELIESLKLNTAKCIINELETHFSHEIRENNELQADIFFKKGQILYFKDRKKAFNFIHDAYTYFPTNNVYIQWEILRLLTENKLDEAQILLSSSQCKSKWRHLINVLLSENKEKTYNNLPEEIRNDYEFREILFECLLNSKYGILNFLFEDSDISVPENLTFSTLYSWLYVISYYRLKTGNFLVLSFNAPQIMDFESALNISKIFYDKISSTEIKNDFSIILCLHCYWSFVCSHDSSWIDEYQKINKVNFGEQKQMFSLMEASMLILDKRFEEAFAVIASNSEKINDSVIKFSIMMSIHSDNIMHLRWILERMNDEHLKVNSEIAVLIAHSINKHRALETKDILQNSEFNTDAEKEILLQLCAFNASQKIDIATLKNNVNEMCDELKAYAANLLAINGDTEMAFNMLKPIVDEDVPDLKRSMYIAVLSKMQEKTPDLYRILVKNRLAGNFCDDQLLKIEYELDSQIADTENALAAISMLYERHPEDPGLFTHYIYTLGKLHPEQLTNFEKKAIEIQFLNTSEVVLAYRAFSENNYLKTAIALLYKAAKATEDIQLRTFYHSETINGLICPIAREEYEIAEEGHYVLCDIDGKRVFYQATINGSNINKAVLGVHKNDIIELEIAYEKVSVTIIGIHNKYYKLAGDILKDAQDGSNPQLIPIKIDMDKPLESLDAFIRKMSKDDLTPKEKWERACKQYENGEIGLSQLVDENNILAGYYKLLFTSFKIHVNNSTVELQAIPKKLDDKVFVLDMPTVITFSEFSAKTGIKLDGLMTVTTLLHEYIKSADKSSIRLIDSGFIEAINAGNLIRYSEYVDLDIKERLHKIKEWINNHCKDIVADKALALFSKKDDISPLQQLLLGSMSMLLQPNCYFVTDDRKISTLLPNTKIITSETFVHLFNDTQISSAYSEFLLENNFLGVYLTKEYIINEYQKMKHYEENNIVKIMQNMQENPLLLSQAVSACIELANKEIDLNTLKITFTNIFTMSLKGFDMKVRKEMLQFAINNLNIPFSCMQFTKQCLLDGAFIANGGKYN